MNKQQSLLACRKMKGSSRKIVPLMALSWLFIIAIIIPVYYYLFHNINYSSKPEAEAAAYHSNSQISINSLIFNPHHHRHHRTTTNTSIINKTTTPASSSSSASSIQLDNNNNGDQEESLGNNITASAAAAKNGQAMMTKEKDSCDLSLGEWVPNPEGPYYTNTTCSAIQEHQNCMRFGRPDTDFQKWRWKPEGCELPIFDPLEFLEMMRGKKLAFVGDSVARNHMQSLICLLSRVEEAIDVSETPSSSYWSQFRRYEYRKHNFTMAIFWSPYLVRTTQLQEPPFNLFLDEPDPNWTQQIPGFDYVIISAGHWFSRPAIFYIQNQLAGCLYCPQSNITHLTTSFSYRHAFRTAFRAIVQRTNFTGITFLRSFAPSHFENGYWDQGGDCVRQRPYRPQETQSDDYTMELYQIQLDQLKIAQREGRGRALKFRMMDVTRAMLMRPDGHPSKYGHLPNANVVLYNDCVHWCLPGPVDSWNDFLIQLLRREKAS